MEYKGQVINGSRIIQRYSWTATSDKQGKQMESSQLRKPQFYHSRQMLKPESVVPEAELQVRHVNTLLTFTASIPTRKKHKSEMNQRLLRHKYSNCTLTLGRNSRGHLRTFRVSFSSYFTVRRFPDKTRTECVLFSPSTIHYIHHAYLLFQSKSIVNTFIWTITQTRQSSHYT